MLPSEQLPMEINLLVETALVPFVACGRRPFERFRKSTFVFIKFIFLYQIFIRIESLGFKAVTIPSSFLVS